VMAGWQRNRINYSTAAEPDQSLTRRGLAALVARIPATLEDKRAYVVAQNPKIDFTARFTEQDALELAQFRANERVRQQLLRDVVLGLYPLMIFGGPPRCVVERHPLERYVSVGRMDVTDEGVEHSVRASFMPDQYITEMPADINTDVTSG